jgi:hypothetical protein
MTFCPALLLPGISAAWVGAAGLNGQSVPMPGVVNTAPARVDYRLKCQGCHRIDGGGDDRSNPPMRDMVVPFLTVPGGRQCLAPVPGVATVDLDDRRLANLVNWTIYTFDPQHVPKDFRPDTSAEPGRLRQNPLLLERAETRARLVARLTLAGRHGDIMQ